jgi:hypothetical protein
MILSLIHTSVSAIPQYLQSLCRSCCRLKSIEILVADRSEVSQSLGFLKYLKICTVLLSMVTGIYGCGELRFCSKGCLGSVRSI